MSPVGIELRTSQCTMIDLYAPKPQTLLLIQYMFKCTFVRITTQTYTQKIQESRQQKYKLEVINVNRMKGSHIRLRIFTVIAF